MLFCYFPITFKAQPEDDSGLTSALLKKQLRLAISSNPEFAPFAIPALIDKLTSDSWAAKHDSLEVICDCFGSFGSDGFSPHLIAIWTCLKQSVFNAQDQENELIALKCIREMTKCMTKSATVLTRGNTFETGNASALSKFVELVTGECLEDILGKQSYGKQCGGMLMSAASCSPSACLLIYGKTFNQILNAMSDPDYPIPKQAVCLQVLVKLLTSVQCVFSSTPASNPLILQKSQVLELFVGHILNDTSYMPLRTASVKGIYTCLLMSDIFCEEDLHLMGVNLTTTALKHQFKDDVYSLGAESLRGMILLALNCPNLIIRLSLPIVYDDIIASAGNNVNLLEKIAAASSEIWDKGIVFLLGQFISHLTQPILENSKSLLMSIQKMLQIRQISDAKYDFAPFQILERIFNIKGLVDLILSGDEGFEEIFGGVVGIVTQISDFTVQGCIFKLILSHESKSMKNIVRSLYVNCICYLRSESILHVNLNSQFMKSMIYEAINSHDQTHCEAVGKICGSIINKTFTKQGSIDFLSQMYQEFGTASQQISKPNVGNGLILIYCWIAKGLIMQQQESGLEIASSIMQLLEDGQLCSVAAYSVGIIIKDFDVFSKQAFTRCSILYKQRFYNHVIPYIYLGFDNALGENKNCFLVSLSHLLRNIPKVILLAELPKLFPMLIFSLNSLNADLKLATLGTIQFIAVESPTFLAKQRTTLFSNLIALSRYAKDVPSTNPVLIFV